MSQRAERLPRGRHGLTRAEVEQSQRNRMLQATADTLIDKGYAKATVADIIGRAKVSRATFYQHFSSKLDCFMHAFDHAAGVVLEQLRAAQHRSGTPVERFEGFFGTYLDLLAEQPALSRVFLVEVYAAGPEAMDRRAAFQARIVRELARLLEVDDEDGRFACEMLVAAVSTMVTRPLVKGDLEALRALRRPVISVVRRALETTG